MCDDFRLFKDWSNDLAKRRSSEATCRTYRYNVHRTFGDLGVDPRKVTGKMLRDYLGERTKAHGESIHNALADFFRFLVRRGERPDNPLEMVRRPKPRRAVKRQSLTREEVIRLLVAACYVGHGNVRWSGERWAWTFLAHYMTRPRPGEMVNLRTDQLHLNGSSSHVVLEGTKTGEDRVVPLSMSARVAFGVLAEGRDGILIGVKRSAYWRQMKKFAVAAGLPKAKQHPYVLRHSFARHMVEAGTPDPDVAYLLGHRDMRYIHVYTWGDNPAHRRAVRSLDRFEDPPTLFEE